LQPKSLFVVTILFHGFCSLLRKRQEPKPWQQTNDTNMVQIRFCCPGSFEFSPSLLEPPETTSSFSLKHTSRCTTTYGINDVDNRTPPKSCKITTELSVSLRPIITSGFTKKKHDKTQHKPRHAYPHTALTTLASLAKSSLRSAISLRSHARSAR
jgi:hypothetical protein